MYNIGPLVGDVYNANTLGALQTNILPAVNNVLTLGNSSHTYNAVWAGQIIAYNGADGIIYQHMQTAGFQNIGVISTVQPNALDNFYGYNITANIALTIGAPSATPIGLTLFTVAIKNTSGGALTTTPAWNAIYHFGSGGTPASPASAQQLNVTFWYDPVAAIYYELARTTGLAN